MTLPSFIQLSSADNVVVATSNLARGTLVAGCTVSVDIPRGHKLAIQSIEPGDGIIKYGQVIGIATTAIQPGDHVHVHNIRAAEERDERRAGKMEVVPPDLSGLPKTFMGYRRADGRAGTRNFIGIMTSVNCSGTVAKLIAEEAGRMVDVSKYGVDGIAAFPHTTGCGMSDQGGGYEILKRTLEGFIIHPNFGGVIMVGLGCEQFQIARLMKETGIERSDRFQFLTIQQSGGTRATIDAGVELVRKMLPVVGNVSREPIPVSELSVALQCGGSDSYSGITANPALGRAVDMLVALGGSAILTETPEIIGAEHLLAARAADSQVSQRLYNRLDWWVEYTRFFGNVLNNNPSPGNKAGGLTTIMEKSLGAVTKGGASPLEQVVDYAERPVRRGLIFMDGPGFDPCSATGQIACGANVLCFTTGRGSAFGCKPVPSIKLASNSQLFEHMRDDMDINCGDVVSGTSLDDKGREIFHMIVDTASGRQTRSEHHGYGDLEFIPWQLHAVL
ncbi:MAG: altronate dehydratase [Mesorhizobium sp.]|nr:altronate dehydratase family protein [Mesorhizobium sp.]MBL8579093.1 altronate dehydratase [Mesorhizobium sp.]